MKQSVVRLSHITFSYHHQEILNDLSWTLYSSENWAVRGKSGSGKTTLAKIIAGQLNGEGEITFHFNPASLLPAKVYYISSWEQFTSLEGDRNFYYQQRYNKHQQNDTKTVLSELLDFGVKENLAIETIEKQIAEFGFDNAKETQLIELSSGEHKKLQLIKGLWLKPQLLIIDQPFTGLDKHSRIFLNAWIDALSQEGVQFILIGNEDELPTCIQHFAEIQNGKFVEISPKKNIEAPHKRVKKPIPYFLTLKPKTDYSQMIAMHDIQIRYGDKIVLKEINWEVNVGEKWLLQGHNGSGKSTLLSLINGDHPQVYGLDLQLFGQKRGSGESIWDIKEKIGMISPEMHWYFDQNATVWQTIASGFYDSIGWFLDVKYEESQKINQILDFFELTEHKNELLTQLPLGKQRLAMLARTIIKNPPLLVLDEPTQGLDDVQTTYFNDVVDELAQHGKTLIYVGHFESQIPSCITHKLVLEKGRIINNEQILEKELNQI